MPYAYFRRKRNRKPRDYELPEVLLVLGVGLALLLILAGILGQDTFAGPW